MNEYELGKKIAQRLNNSVNNVGQNTLDRLQAAREAALAKYAEPKKVFGTVLTTGTHGKGVQGLFGNPRAWVTAVALVIGLTTLTFWQNSQNGDVSEVDAALLAGDLPVHAYLDNGFDTWLKRASQ